MLKIFNFSFHLLIYELLSLVVITANDFLNFAYVAFQKESRLIKIAIFKAVEQ